MSGLLTERMFEPWINYSIHDRWASYTDRMNQLSRYYERRRMKLTRMAATDKLGQIKMITAKELLIPRRKMHNIVY